jgi:hypothetical protein
MRISTGPDSGRVTTTHYGHSSISLSKAPRLSRQEGYAEIPSKFCTAFIKNKYDAKKATQEAFAGVDMNKLDKDMRDFWNNKNLVGKSRTYTPKR